MATTTPTTPEIKSAPRTLAENVKDTLESIVVAFILAFVFRAFIVEAFVIPTGSMAATLYGNHVTRTCSTCGFEYAAGITERMAPYAIPLHCPNCDTSPDRLEPSEIVGPDSGDRILVHKWPFDIGGEYLGPHRWDVTVFKDPKDGTTNFIKRLVGLPGEVIEIIDGDVYTVPLADLKPELVGAMDQLRRDVYRLRLPESQAGLSDNRRREETRREILRRYQEINEQLLPRMTIQRKLPHQTMAQKSLWFNVYDHDFLPSYTSGGSPGTALPAGWQPSGAAAAAAWKTRSREITFESDSAEPLEIRFGGKDKEIDDFYAYNVDNLPGRGQRPRQYVGDVRLRFTWLPDGGGGGLRLAMNRDEDDFVATIGADGRIKIEGYHPEADGAARRQTIGEYKLGAFPPGRPVAIEFINLDYRVALFIDQQEVIASSSQQYSPRLPKLRRLVTATLREIDGYVEVQPTQVRIAAHQLKCRLRHLAIERDVYYRSQEQQEDVARDEKGKLSGIYNPYYRWPGWGTAGMPLMLRGPHDVNGQTYGGEYFMLGDNSPASKDSRLWWEIGPPLLRLGSDYQVGTVPDDQLIGKAFFVYWPAGYRPSFAPRIGMIPNFGRMRWIR